MSNLIKIEAADYGLEEKTAQNISKMFKPMLDCMEGLEKEHNEIVKLEKSEETSQKAKELRLRLVKVRTGTAKIHKELKQFYLNGGRFVDGWKNTQLVASQKLEENLKNIEDYYTNIEKERVAKLKEQRQLELDEYGADGEFVDLGNMPEDVWINYIAGVKNTYEAKIEAERKTEEDRIAKEKEAEEERIKYEKYHKLLNKRIGETRSFVSFIDGYDKIDLALLTNDEFKQLCNDAIAKRTEYEAEKEIIRQENERLKNIADKEAKERAKLEAELQARKETEARCLAEDQERLALEAKKSEKEKFADFMEELKAVTEKYSFKTKEYKESFTLFVWTINNNMGSN